MENDENNVRRRLNDLKSDLEAMEAQTEDNRKPVSLDQQSVGRLSRMDSLQVQAMDMAQQQARRRQIVRINAALERLKHGDYGYCVTCDEPIGKRRLELDPATPLCVKCAK